MRIVAQQGIEDAPWKHLVGWSERVFPIEGEGKEWSQVGWHLLAFDHDDMPVAHIGYDRFTIMVNDKPLVVLGIGGVVVRPEYQGRGIPGLLFNELHSRVGPDVGVGVYILFCPQRLVPYYQKQGYSQHKSGVTFPQFGTEVESIFELLYRSPMPLNGAIKLLTPPW